MKQLILFFFVVIGWQLHAQDYARLKVFVTDLELAKLAGIGVAVDHGIRKENQFFISDFSAAERQQMDSNGFSYEVLIEDVEA